MSTKRQNQKEKQKIMQPLQEHNEMVAEPKILSCEVGDTQKQFQIDNMRDSNEYLNSDVTYQQYCKKELNLDQFEQFPQNSSNNLIDNNYPLKMMDSTQQQDCKKIQKQNASTKQTNDFQQLQEIQNPNQLDRKSLQKQSKETKPQSTLNEEIKTFEERIVKYTSEVNQEIKLSPKLSDEWKKKFTFIKKKK
ncbi:unnamed protein product (macronuclear) [Paramecium tetraurelia]|uniref:Uncharacterized protein n=1 Tax=Paramecium tetraurelia TaxID=5888 RepID=A0BGP3_PARTE|nr:uncharacterized protein GSPATT00028745001 [Paramecium tetraurelia]CAK57710.1 unnamed protein product [Paramecium tetraurelia]|eukprot:XP_001425108.1 hypothetical protein (macronuclear) [Paramecium tetraurelia strain d4-2]